ncbi:hypothetical protein PENSPDRAFT_671935 [Peniophora sp. CONT]|nr:hypothetical protein PENSPDRAFT_671935 [Peniophora sp. CONT]
MSNNKRGAPDRTLSKEQSRYLRTIVEGEFTTHVSTNDPNFKGYKTISGWVSDKVQSILNSEGFKGDAEADPEGMKRTITTRFRNHYNNKLKKDHIAALAASTTTASTASLPLVNDRFIKLLLPPLTGRQLYEAENKEGIIKQSSGGGVAEYQRLLKIAWDGLDEDEKDEWVQRAEVEEHDLEQNRILLRDNLASQLTRICCDARFGGMTMFMQVSYRQLDGKIKSFSAEGGLPDAALFLDDEQSKSAYSSFTRAWRQHSNAALPHSKESRSSSPDVPIPRNANGMPVFPEVDSGSTPHVALSAIITAYLEEVWTYSRADLGRDDESLPWNDVAACPEEFYDVDSFPFLSFVKADLKDPVVRRQAGRRSVRLGLGLRTDSARATRVLPPQLVPQLRLSNISSYHNYD